jgi:hypothetical protein
VPVTGSRELYLSVLDNIKIYNNILEGILKSMRPLISNLTKKEKAGMHHVIMIN